MNNVVASVDAMRGGTDRVHVVEILHIDDCQNWPETARRANVALEIAQISDVNVVTRAIRTSAEARESGFAGSPTVLIDGLDAFPSDGRTLDLACRVYAGPFGLAPYPSVEQLAAAFVERMGAS